MGSLENSRSPEPAFHYTIVSQVQKIPLSPTTLLFGGFLTRMASFWTFWVELSGLYLFNWEVLYCCVLLQWFWQWQSQQISVVICTSKRSTWIVVLISTASYYCLKFLLSWWEKHSISKKVQRKQNITCLRTCWRQRWTLLISSILFDRYRLTIIMARVTNPLWTHYFIYILRPLTRNNNYVSCSSTYTYLRKGQNKSFEKWTH